MNIIKNATDAVRSSPRPVRSFLLGSVFFGTGVAVFEVFFNLYLQKEGVSKSLIGGFLSQRAIGTVLGSLAAGTAIFAKRPSLIFSGSSVLLFISLATLIYARDDTIRQVAATCYGFSGIFRLVGAAPFFFKHAKEEWLATLLGLDAAIIAGTQVIGAALAAVLFFIFQSVNLTDSQSFRLTLLLGAGSALVAAAFFSRAAGAPAPHAAQRETVVLQKPPPISLYIKMCVPFFFVGAGAGLTIPYLNLYFEDRFNVPPSMISIFYAAVALTTTFGYLASPILAERFGLVKSVVFSEVASIPFFLILAWSASLPLSIAAFLMRGALMNLPYPLYGNLIMRLVGPAHRERANALTKLAWNGSWVVTARLAGWLLDAQHGDYVPVMLTTAGLYLLASSSFWLFFGKSGL